MKGIGYLIGGVIGIVVTIIGLVFTAITPLSNGSPSTLGILYALIMGIGFVLAISLFDMRRV